MEFIISNFNRLLAYIKHSKKDGILYRFQKYRFNNNYFNMNNSINVKSEVNVLFKRAKTFTPAPRKSHGANILVLAIILGIALVFFCIILCYIIISIKNKIKGQKNNRVFVENTNTNNDTKEEDKKDNENEEDKKPSNSDDLNKPNETDSVYQNQFSSPYYNYPPQEYCYQPGFYYTPQGYIPGYYYPSQLRGFPPRGYSRNSVSSFYAPYYHPTESMSYNMSSPSLPLNNITNGITAATSINPDPCISNSKSSEDSS